MFADNYQSLLAVLRVVSRTVAPSMDPHRRSLAGLTRYTARDQSPQGAILELKDAFGMDSSRTSYCSLDITLILAACPH